jgi:hypothetical protein
LFLDCPSQCGGRSGGTLPSPGPLSLPRVRVSESKRHAHGLGEGRDKVGKRSSRGFSSWREGEVHLVLEGESEACSTYHNTACPLASGNLAHADMYGYIGYLWISMDIYGVVWIYMGLQRNISDLLYWIRYPSWISIHIHAYPFISMKDLQRYPYFTSKSHISALFMLLSIKVSIYIHIPLCISMCIQVRSPS